MSDNAQNTAEEIEMIRRFERSEIILHWSNAVPFLILFVTGALNILSRFFVFSPAFLKALHTVHKIVGPLWIVCIAFSFFSSDENGTWRIFASNSAWAGPTSPG